MPPVFAQPSPVSNYSSSSSGGGFDAGAYVSLARALQDRYASDADRQLRAQLGFANLYEDRAARQEGLQLQAAHMAMQPALQQQRADLEVRNWMFQQDFNRQDQQELARQQAAASELQDKLDKGEISQKEFYRMFGDLAPRVNYLQAKEQHTRNRAFEEQKNALAMQNKQVADLTAQRNKIMQMTADDRYVFNPDPRAYDLTAAEYDALNPGAKQLNPAERELQIRDMMKNRGLGQMWVLQPDGKLEQVHPPKAESGSTRSASGAHGGEFTYKNALAEAEAEAASKGLMKDTPEFNAAVKESVDRQKQMFADRSPEGIAASREAAKQQSANKHQVMAAEVQGMGSLNPGEKQAAMVLVGVMDNIVKQFGVPPSGSPLRKKLDDAADKYQAIIKAGKDRGQQAQPGQPAPQQEQQKKANLTPGYAGVPLEFGQSAERDVERAKQIAGNLGQSIQGMLAEQFPHRFTAGGDFFSELIR